MKREKEKGGRRKEGRRTRREMGRKGQRIRKKKLSIPGILFLQANGSVEVLVTF